jgi:hypothetical protein
MHTVTWIDMSHLRPSPWATIGTGHWRQTLHAWIARTGRYEPLVVRPCDASPPQGYEIIHGHGRWRVLRELGHEKVACVVWEVTELEALLYAATMNRVRGREVARKRLALLREIRRRAKKDVHVKDINEENGGANDLYRWMGERLGQRAEVLHRVLSSETRHPTAPAPTAAAMKEAFTVFLLPEEKRRLVAKLREADPDVGRGVVRALGIHHGTNATKTHER